jgi:hypothetical protein
MLKLAQRRQDKCRSGFFEDYALAMIPHAVPRTISGGERALYHALMYPARGALLFVG